MSPDVLAQQLLEESDVRARATLLGQSSAGISLIEALKTLVDRHKDTDSTLALLAGERALEAAPYIDNPRAQPLAWWAVALGLTVRGSFAEAIEPYEKARTGFAALGLLEEAARTAVREVQALAMMGNLPGALALAETTYQAFVRLELMQDAATVGINLGIIYSRLGRMAEAEAVLLQALGQLTTLEDEVGQAKAHSNLGYVYQQQDRFQEAVIQFEVALNMFRLHNQTQFLAGTSLNLALLYRNQGRLTAALELLSRARDTYGSLEINPDAAFVGLEEARIYLDLNLLGEAERLSKELAQVFEARAMSLEQAESLMTLGLAQAKAHKLEEARQTLAQARELWLGLGNTLQATLVELSIANLWLQEGRKGGWTRLEQAVLQSARATEGLANMPSARAFGLSILAEALLELGNHSEARHRLDEATAAIADLGLPDLRIRLEGLSGRVAWRDQPVAAEAHFKRAIELLEGVRATLGVDEFKTAYLGDKLDVYGNLVDLLLDQGRSAEALEYAERAKSRALLELLAGRGEQTEQSVETERLEQELGQARRELDQYLLANPAAHRAQIAACEERITRIQRQLERSQPEARLEHLPPIRLEEVRATLPADAVLVEYFSTPKGLVAFLLDKAELRVVRNLGSLAQVEQALERLEFFLSRVAQGEVFNPIYGEGVLQQSVDEQLRMLHGLLLEPLALTLSGQALVVVPHAALHKIPFAALLGKEGYLIDQAEVSIAASAAIYAFCRRRPSQTKGPLVAFGLALEDIPQVLEEVQSITQIAHQAHKFVQEAASTHNFFAEAGQAQVLHLATHGAFRPDNPMFSGLRLSDGWLAARDLYRLRLKAELVVLSACESGLSKQAGGDELLGLARGFLYAGAPSLLASLWPVKDDSTAKFMRGFYRFLQAGLPVATALRQAQQALRKNLPNPYYWAAFTLTGDPGRRVVI